MMTQYNCTELRIQFLVPRDLISHVKVRLYYSSFHPIFPKEFHIQLAESESEEEQVESESEIETSGEGVKVAHRPPTVDEIDSVLGLFRRDAEVRQDY